jgi:hypothetical protein
MWRSPGREADRTLGPTHFGCLRCSARGRQDTNSYIGSVGNWANRFVNCRSQIDVAFVQSRGKTCTFQATSRQLAATVALAGDKA